MEGLRAARARGRKGGRPAKDKSVIDLALTLYDSNHYSVEQILQNTVKSRGTLYNYLQKRQAEK